MSVLHHGFSYQFKWWRVTTEPRLFIIWNFTQKHWNQYNGNRNGNTGNNQWNTENCNINTGQRQAGKQQRDLIFSFFWCKVTTGCTAGAGGTSVTPLVSSPPRFCCRLAGTAGIFLSISPSWHEKTVYNEQPSAQPSPGSAVYWEIDVGKTSHLI